MKRTAVPIIALCIASVCAACLYAQTATLRTNLPTFGIQSAIERGKKVGIIEEDRVNIRATYSIKSAVIGQKNKGEIVFIYAEKGTKTIINDIWDYWYKIEDQKEAWINALYICMFPLRYEPSSTEVHHFLDPFNPQTPGTPWKTIARDELSHGGRRISDRSIGKYPYNNQQDYWYQIALAFESKDYQEDDSWVHGSEIIRISGKQRRVLDTTENPMEFESIPLPIDLTPFLGTPIEIRKNENPPENEWPSIEYQYPGLEVVSYIDRRNNTQFLEGIVLTEAFASPIIKYGLNIGVSESYVSSCLGSPTRISDQVWIYIYNPNEVTNPLELTMEEKKIKKILWFRQLP